MKKITKPTGRMASFVYFDLDGTLHDMAAAAEMAVKAALELASQQIGFGKPLIPAYAQLFQLEYFEYTRQRVILRPADALPTLFYRTLGPDYPNLGPEDALFGQLSAVWQEHYVANSNKPFPSVVELLEWLGQQRIGCGVISNGAGRYQRRKLLDLGLKEYFSEKHLLFSDEQEVAKPEPKMFRLALKRSETSAEQTIFVGDSPVTDVPGALAVGFTVIWLNVWGLKAPDAAGYPGTLHEVGSFSQAAELIRQMVQVVAGDKP